jgi:2-methylcitrate dehydratase PrpD
MNFGTMTKPMHAGVANRTAIEATLLARDGFTASPEALDGRFGRFDAICRGEGDLARVVAGLRRGAPDTFAIEEGLWYKPYSCCGANHHAIEGMLRLLDEHGLNIDDVDRVDVSVDPFNINEVLVYPWPASGLKASSPCSTTWPPR